jgi:hypothetical protein
LLPPARAGAAVWAAVEAICPTPPIALLTALKAPPTTAPRAVESSTQQIQQELRGERYDDAGKNRSPRDLVY